MKKCVFNKEKVIDTVYEKHIIVLLNTSLMWDFNLVEFDRNGEISWINTWSFTKLSTVKKPTKSDHHRTK